MWSRVHWSDTTFLHEFPVHMKSPDGTVLVHPRRKAGQVKLGKGCTAVLLTKSDLEKLMHLRLGEASEQLGLSASTVKKACRTLGIYKWRAQSQSVFDNRRAFAYPAHSHASEQASCVASGPSVASGSGLGIVYTTPTSAAQERAVSVTSPSASSSSTVHGGKSADPSEALNPTPEGTQSREQCQQIGTQSPKY